jgi:hypothetical protein
MTAISTIDDVRALGTTAPSTSTATRFAARVAGGAATAFVAVLALLHVLKSELDPSWRMISEYEIGRHGWVMRAAFVLVAVACAALHRAVRGQVDGVAGTIGRLGLGAAAIGTLLAGVFATDPITATEAELTTQGNLHGLGFALGGPGLIVAVTLLTRALRRSAGRTAVIRVARATVLASIAAFAVVMATTYDGTFSSDVPIGWPNRLLMVGFAAWVVGVARLVRSADAAR